MALVRCSECRRKVSTKAATCPSCGAPVPTKTRSGDIPLGVGCLVVCGFTALMVSVFNRGLEDRHQSYSPQVASPTLSNSRAATQPAAQIQLPESIDASGIGLRGILDESVPPNLSDSVFHALGDSWSEWSIGTVGQLKRLYEEPELDLAAQRIVLSELRENLDTIQRAMADPAYRSIIDPLATIHVRLNRRTIMAEAVLATLDANDGQNHETQLHSANASTIDTLNELERWLRDDVPEGSVWLEFINADAIRKPAEDAADVEALREVVQKLSNLDGMENDAQREFIQKPRFSKLKDCIQRQIALCEAATHQFDESAIRNSLARLIYAVELWEVDRSTRSYTLIETAIGRCDGEIPDTTLINDALGKTYHAKNILTQPSKLCEVISGIVGFDVGWKKSRVFDGEWVTSPAGPSIEFGRSGYAMRPNLFFYATGTRPSEVQKLTLKLNLNGSSDHNEGRRRLIDAMKSLLEVDGQSLPPNVVNQVQAIESVSNPQATQSDEVFLLAHFYEHYRLELLYETGAYTAIMLRLIPPDPAPVDENQKASDSLSGPRSFTGSPSDEMDWGSTSRAYTEATFYVEERLVAPSTAKWPGIFDGRRDVKSLGRGKYRVKSWVDSENRFGAMLRMHYECVSAR